MKYSYFYFLLFLLFVCPILAQEKSDESCSFESVKEEFYKEHPEALLKAIEFEKKVQQQTLLKSMGAKKAGEKYVIPVVFHIYGTDWANKDGVVTTSEVTDELVKESLKSINEDFKGFNDPVDPSFANIEGGMDIEFRLAQIDPNGNTTTGIIHHEFKEGFGLNGASDEEIGRYAWDNYKYMNIHIQVIIKAGSRTNSGVAWFPNTSMSDEGSARVVYNGRYMKYRPPASSLTHEFGHFLGLEHTFANGGCISGGTDAGDFVADTPPTDAGTASIGSKECKTDVRNCFNQRINYQNHMDYNPCESMFTKGQVTRMEAYMEHEARITLWQQGNLKATGVDKNLGARILFNYQDRLDNELYKFLSLVEGFENDGRIINKRKIKAIEGARFATTGDLTEGVHFTSSNIPSGLKAKVTVLDNVTAEISLEGRAATHENANSVDFKITFLNPAISGGVSSIYSATGTYSVEFIDTYETHYETLSPYLGMGYSMQNYPNPTNTKFRSLGIGGTLKFNLQNFDGNQIGVDNINIDMDVLCEPNSTNVKMISKGGVINQTGNWVPKRSINDSPPIISNDQYTVWRGKTGYIGVRIRAVNGEYLYAWLKAKVSPDGEMAYITNVGINPDIGNSIRAEIEGAYVDYSSDRFLESDADDGTVEEEIKMTLNGVSFATTGTLTENVHYTAESIPRGTELKVNVINSNTAYLSLVGVLERTGRDGYFGWDTYRHEIKINLKDAALSNNDASNVRFTEFNPKLEYMGDIHKRSLTGEILDIAAGQDFGAIFTLIDSFKNTSNQSISYAIQHYDEDAQEVPGVKFISRRKDAVANDNYELIPLDQGTLIGPNSSWKNGRQHFVGSGQHMIDSESYRAWRGRTKYVGIRIRRSGRLHYGWIKLRVSSQAKSFEFLEFGINGVPEAGIYAGTLDSDGIAGYCEAKGNAGPEAVTNVTFAGINNTSQRDSSGYTNYTTEIANVSKGSSYNLSVSIDGYNGGNNDEIYAWFDWNKDKDFEDSGEYVKLNKTSGTKGEASIRIPSNAQSGKIRMRIRVAYDAKSNVPCGDMRYGEVEDYTLNIGSGGTVNTPPTVSITSPNNGTAIEAGNTIGITASASDSDGNITRVEFFNGNTKLGEDTSSPYSFNWSNIAEGSYSLTARATDNDGSSTTSSTINVTVTSPIPDYCTANGENGTEAILQVRFGEINNTSVRSSSGYEDYTNMSTSVNIGSAYSLTVNIEGYRGGESDEIYAWFDWNKDGDFNDENEFVTLNKTYNTTGNASIRVPDNAQLGATGMRIRVAYHAASNKPCGSVPYGEVEDYALIITNDKSAGTALDESITVSTYPNPVTNGEINVNFNTSQKGPAVIQLFDLAGKKIFETITEKGEEQVKSVKFNSDLPAGFYILKTKLGNNFKQSTNKVIIQ